MRLTSTRSHHVLPQISIVDHELRFTPMLLTARRLLREGVIGTVSAAIDGVTMDKLDGQLLCMPHVLTQHLQRAKPR